MSQFNQQEPPLKKYKTSDRFINEVRHNVNVQVHNEAQINHTTTQKRLSVVISDSNNKNQEIVHIDRNITIDEEDLKTLKEKPINNNKELQDFKLEETRVKIEEASLVSLLNEYPSENIRNKGNAIIIVISLTNDTL